MRSTSFLGSLALAAILIAAPAQADQILVYKYSSSRPWAQYDCYRPDVVSTPAAPVIPKSMLAGTYTQTEYWIINRTTNELANVVYYTYVVSGATVKAYYSNPASPLVRSVDITDKDGNNATDSVPMLQYRLAGLPAANTFNVMLMFGDHQYDTSTDLNGDALTDSQYSDEEGHLFGLGKLYTVVTGIVFPKVATSLTGNYHYASAANWAGASSTYFRTLYFEGPTPQTLTLDAVLTKNANTGAPLIPYGGGAPVTNGTTAYGVRVAELVLEGLGYDNSTDP